MDYFLSILYPTRCTILSLCALFYYLSYIKTLQVHWPLRCEWTSTILRIILSIFIDCRRLGSCNLVIRSISCIHMFPIVYLLSHLEPLFLPSLKSFCSLIQIIKDVHPIKSFEKFTLSSILLLLVWSWRGSWRSSWNWIG